MCVLMQVLDEEGEPFDMEELCLETSMQPLRVYLMSVSGEDDLLLELPHASQAFEWVHAFQQHSHYATVHPGMLDRTPGGEGGSVNKFTASRKRGSRSVCDCLRKG